MFLGTFPYDEGGEGVAETATGGGFRIGVFRNHLGHRTVYHSKEKSHRGVSNVSRDGYSSDTVGISRADKGKQKRKKHQETKIL